MPAQGIHRVRSGEVPATSLFVAVVRDRHRVIAALTRIRFPKAALIQPTTGEAVQALAALVAPAMPDLPAVLGTTPNAHAFAVAWQARSGRAQRTGAAQRLFEATEVVPDRGRWVPPWRKP